jgi:hypothetical protein
MTGGDAAAGDMSRLCGHIPAGGTIETRDQRNFAARLS